MHLRTTSMPSLTSGMAVFITQRMRTEIHKACRQYCHRKALPSVKTHLTTRFGWVNFSKDIHQASICLVSDLAADSSSLVKPCRFNLSDRHLGSWWSLPSHSTCPGMAPCNQ